MSSKTKRGRVHNVMVHPRLGGDRHLKEEGREKGVSGWSGCLKGGTEGQSLRIVRPGKFCGGRISESLKEH